ncbi:MAG TPA: ATP-dependent DNA helicase RecG, partial [Phycisphaerae bacterium]
TAIQRYHRPTQADDVQIARRRLAYDEFLILQLAVQLRRQFRKQHASAPAIIVTPEIDRRIRARLPFQLTPGQNQVVAAITSDLARTQPMNRLLQADVGAGKTAVAVYAALATVANRRQVAIMAPTEILAEQHRAKFGAYLEGSRVRVGYLVGGQSKAARQHTLRSVAAGEIDVLIGTHALLETGVRFAACGLVVVDEQHKFGVFQRSAILNKPAAQQAHYLVLTATPIPRTLALTLFGDLDVSVIPDGPPGRQPITTRVVQAEEIAPVWDFVRQRLAAGEQAYVVYPLVDESDRLPLQAATREYEHLKHAVFADFGVDLLHGRMSTAEKTAVMNRFRTGASRVLVATTVIEVGVDVPAATIMVVQHAERYGLSQLHQLRGRIGRGARKSYCILVDHGSQISDFRSQIPELNRHARDQSEIARRKSETDSRRGLARLEIMARTADGFQIAEEDLRLRGPGEVVGARQHGLPTLKVADLLSDLELLDWARADAARIVEADGRLSQPRFAALRAQVIARHGETAALTG